MQVYAEYAFLENFCMDFALLAIAKVASRNPAKYGRVAAASALGACFAIVYPLIGVGGALGIAVKIVAGVGMCAIAGRFQTIKGFLKFAAIFTAATFVTGGALVALFSLAGVSYESGGGYILSSVPVGIPLFCVIVLFIAVRKIRAKFVNVSRATADCKIFVKDKSATCHGFYDSGNKVYLSGAPVSIIPAHVAKKLTETEGIKTFVDIHTVAGKSKIKVFTADKIEIDDGKNKLMRQNVILGISPQPITKMVLNPDLSEVN